MELALNLVWVFLALPAYWLWRRDYQASCRRPGSWLCLLALSCVLVLLFPVISATDDVHAIRAEMEDSPVSKRTVRQTGSDKGSAWVNRLQTPPARVAGVDWWNAPEVGRLEASATNLPARSSHRVFHVGRAPPFFLLG